MATDTYLLIILELIHPPTYQVSNSVPDGRPVVPQLFCGCFLSLFWWGVKIAKLFSVEKLPLNNAMAHYKQNYEPFKGGRGVY